VNWSDDRQSSATMPHTPSARRLLRITQSLTDDVGHDERGGRSDEHQRLVRLRRQLRVKADSPKLTWLSKSTGAVLVVEMRARPTTALHAEKTPPTPSSAPTTSTSATTAARQRYLIRELEKLGNTVTLQPAA
jgi:hypothetical protein